MLVQLGTSQLNPVSSHCLDKPSVARGRMGSKRDSKVDPNVSTLEPPVEEFLKLLAKITVRLLAQQCRMLDNTEAKTSKAPEG